jgi:hypothetical protein
MISGWPTSSIQMAGITLVEVYLKGKKKKSGEIFQ